MLIKNLSIIILNDRQDQVFEQALLSAAPAEELIVFDQGTTNNWLILEKKLKKLNPHLRFRLIIRRGIIDNFAVQRNQAIKKVHTPWLLFLDSDEVLCKQGLDRIPRLISRKELNAYQLKRTDYFHGKRLRFGETGNCQLLRLARTNHIHYHRQVHEVPVVDGKVEKSNLMIKHFAHQDLNCFLKAINHYAQLEANYRFTEKINYSKTKLLFELIFYPSAKFFLNYFLKLGILDGFAGLAYAVFMSLHSLLVRIYLYEKYFLN
jgi:glycosyltransferase involved in cell wall biosynthesis